LFIELNAVGWREAVVGQRKRVQIDGKVVYTLVLIKEALLQVDCEFDNRVDICNAAIGDPP
jgi:hypothetical protein